MSQSNEKYIVEIEEITHKCKRAEDSYENSLKEVDRLRGEIASYTATFADEISVETNKVREIQGKLDRYVTIYLQGFYF